MKRKSKNRRIYFYFYDDDDDDDDDDVQTQPANTSVQPPVKSKPTNTPLQPQPVISSVQTQPVISSNKLQPLQRKIPTNKLPVQIQPLQVILLPIEKIRQRAIPSNKLPVQLQTLPTIPSNKLPIQLQTLRPAIPTNKLPVQIRPLFADPLSFDMRNIKVTLSIKNICESSNIIKTMLQCIYTISQKKAQFFYTNGKQIECITVLNETDKINFVNTESFILFEDKIDFKQFIEITDDDISKKIKDVKYKINMNMYENKSKEEKQIIYENKLKERAKLDLEKDEVKKLKNLKKQYLSLCFSLKSKELIIRETEIYKILTGFIPYPWFCSNCKNFLKNEKLSPIQNPTNKLLQMTFEIDTGELECPKANVNIDIFFTCILITISNDCKEIYVQSSEKHLYIDMDECTKIKSQKVIFDYNQYVIDIILYKKNKMMGFYIVEEFLNNYTKINEYLRKDPNISSNFFQIIDSIQDFQFIRNETFTFLLGGKYIEKYKDVEVTVEKNDNDNEYKIYVKFPTTPKFECYSITKTDDIMKLNKTDHISKYNYFTYCLIHYKAIKHLQEVDFWDLQTFSQKITVVTW